MARPTSQRRKRMNTSVKVTSSTFVAGLPLTRTLYRRSPHKPGASINSTLSDSPEIWSFKDSLNRELGLAMTKIEIRTIAKRKPLCAANLHKTAI